jgi:hypothetical protein
MNTAIGFHNQQNYLRYRTHPPDRYEQRDIQPVIKTPSLGLKLQENIAAHIKMGLVLCNSYIFVL